MPTAPTRPGVQTSEFWSTLATQVIAAVEVIHPFDVGHWTPVAQAAAVIAAALSSAWYAHGRTKVKTGR